ncbi:MAG: hypothetical protein Q9184_004571, partial [Pyrenodesmia sp. 2 TL-2023]
MSYNNGYNYSPYYQLNGNGNDGRGQNTYQSSASTTGRYQSSGYGASNTQSAQQQPTPANAYAPQQSSYTPTTASADRSTASYSSGYGDSASTNQYQSLRGGYGYPPSSSAANSALGSLAHASSLEQDSRNYTGPRDNRSLQQLIDYNRSQNRHTNSVSPLYGTSTNTNVSYGHQRSDSGAGDSGASHTRDSAISDRRASTSSQQPQYATTAGYSNPTPAHAPTQNHPHSTTESYSSYQSSNQGQPQSTHYPEPTRAPSGQSSHGRNSDTYPTAARSPTHSATQAPSTSISYVSNQNAHTTYRSGQQHASSQQPQLSARQNANSPAQRSISRNSLPAPNTNLNSQRANPPAAANSPTSMSPGVQTPTTVDPSHVFNHQEFQRRQAEAATKKAAEEQARKAAEAEETRKASEAAAALKQVSESRSSNAETSREEQMAAEMRQMIEKMRDYKSKDPSLFTQIWEQVKKTHPAGSIPAAPPISAKDITASGQTPRANGVLSPSPAPSPGIDGLPDLGKFPAQRRRRGGKNDSPVRKRKSKGGVEPVEPFSQVNGSSSGPPIDPAIIEASNQSQLQGVPQAKAVDQPAKDRQVTYVSGTGPQRAHQADTSSQALRPTSTSSGSAPAPSSAKTPAAGKTAWPEHKKWDLAVAAKNILLAMPVNSAKAKSISPEQILSYLNTNPSYEELCQMIESKGVIIERGHFARCLLEAVPGMGAGVQANRQSAAESVPVQANGTTLAPKDRKYLNHNQFRIPTPPKNTHTSVTPTAPMMSAPSQTPNPLQVTKLEQKPPVPLTKQEQARKRNILDIVDLSQLSDDDMPPPPPQKMQRLDTQHESVRPPATNGQTNTFYRIVQQAGTPQHTPVFHTPAMAPPPHYPYAPLPQNPQHSYTPPAPAPPAPAPAVSAGQRELINSEDIVQPIDESKARKRKKYNPKTIVRDVLIAAGRHPTMQPLNHHLDGLRKTFKHVNDMSDLSTFRWDLVDPGDPLPASAPVVTPKNRESQHLGSARDEADGDDADDADAEDQEVMSQSAHQMIEPSRGDRVKASAAVSPAAAVQ